MEDVIVVLPFRTLLRTDVTLNPTSALVEQASGYVSAPWTVANTLSRRMNTMTGRCGHTL